MKKFIIWAHTKIKAHLREYDERKQKTVPALLSTIHDLKIAGLRYKEFAAYYEKKSLDMEVKIKTLEIELKNSRDALKFVEVKVLPAMMKHRGLTMVETKEICLKVRGTSK